MSDYGVVTLRYEGERLLVIDAPEKALISAGHVYDPDATKPGWRIKIEASNRTVTYEVESYDYLTNVLACKRVH